ncbi:unnamed protein product, partial [Prorocentrum cordatum]
AAREGGIFGAPSQRRSKTGTSAVMSPAADPAANCGPAPTCWHMDEAALAESMRELADGVRPWEKGAFTAVRRLQEAERNHGRVDEMSYQGHHVAVKRMPNWRMPAPTRWWDCQGYG